MELDPYNDEYFMRQALKEAQKAYELDEVPVGAVVVCKKTIIARAHNLTEQLNDFTAHAEMQAYTSASSYLNNKYLNECTLYVTLEPCAMCAGAMIQARIARVVYGAGDSRNGAAGTVFNVLQADRLNHCVDIVGGVLADDCAELLRRFFRERRVRARQQ